MFMFEWENKKLTRKKGDGGGVGGGVGGRRRRGRVRGVAISFHSPLSTHLDGLMLLVGWSHPPDNNQVGDLKARCSVEC